MIVIIDGKSEFNKHGIKRLRVLNEFSSYLKVPQNDRVYCHDKHDFMDAAACITEQGHNNGCFWCDKWQGRRS
jgi:hypothetical protein